MLRLIEGGLACAQDERPAVENRMAAPNGQDVAREAERRLKAAGYTVWHMRETATGTAMPRDLRYLAMQIRYAAEAISACSPIPTDFADDCYWPA